MWYFTFGARQRHDGSYVIIHKDRYLDARDIMVERFGIAWSGQYTEADFKRFPYHSKLKLLSEYKKGNWSDWGDSDGYRY